MKTDIDNEKLQRAKKRVKDLKGFYNHLGIYIIVNLVILGANTSFYTEFEMDYAIWRYGSTPIFWGIGLLFHALYIMRTPFNFIKKWEERKIQEYLNREE